MVVYVYRCSEHGVTEQSRPIGTATAAVPCPTCGSPAPRVFTAPRLSLGDPTRGALLDRAERSRDAPEVVSAPPPRPRRRSPTLTDPKLRRLPRP
ncbi:FmdB family zinc ribbon protein [Geodermatophilus ruber]|uniref:Putative regulatory protein, FmdB family n=1 Tax=Geodermatophilus ruber TaxID=504800 RepID=A0A1I4HUI9_9ACTN|nr:zinc ribbon domain-containing protein [Geodermatophilus ruber]SFL45311.1 putative regulatory protein, FmdB family [Geodermatophilus ruber]